ncbi:MAG: sigma 54-interacting transcriptional regulator [Clostridiales Family XIII bacterium]|jgi:transcriptional regulator with PAS, ATPase and Fis domain|nr:sigma 54-interacting transcriptional regulator [Clostridiales Family XIII bacterium]
MTSKQKKNFKEHEMERIAAENSNSISLHDRNNNILLNFHGVKVGNLIGLNASDISGLYNWSPSREAIRTKQPVTGEVDTKYGGKQIVCCYPILDHAGEVEMVVVTAIDKSLVEMYGDALQSPDDTEKLYKITKDFLSISNFSDESIIMESPQMRQVISTAKAVAATDSSVMIVGESGAGKEVVARYIHRHSTRSDRSLVPVNCAAIPHELMESEFFGYVKGAFTGANPQGKIGLFELADGGTIFLDEIGDLPLSMQSKLLRVLESGEVTRLGSTESKTVDVRLIAATNRDLNDLIAHKLFRSDLYFRINVIPITVPSLRDRHDDIIPLAEGILAELNKKYGMNKEFTMQARKSFLEYDWPGNVRELRNVVERMVVTSQSDELYLEERFLEPAHRQDQVSPGGTGLPPYVGTLRSFLANVEEDYIRMALKTSNGKVAEAAGMLGIHRSVLYKKLKAIEQKEEKV